ncbi:MAG: Ferredoxin, 2Fe-2S [Ktedonobacterales bacterium]|nr:MAG: Ferredoxin, 2Fe-2S [Ktedonobacterales bacterium]
MAMEMLEAMEVLEDQTWLDPTGDEVQKVVSRVLAHERPTGMWLDNLLNGVWLGHPLHPVLTDIPVGAWTLGLILDGIESVTRRREYAAGADVAVLVGLGGALASAVTGLAQWQYTIGRQRRLGLSHGLVNVGATVLYGVSAVLRGRGKRGAGKVTALLGYGIVTIGAYIGGDLVYAHRLGVTHVPETELPNEWVRALADAELAEGQLKKVMVADVPVLLVRQHGQVYALNEVCNHLGGPLSEGTLEERCVVCPWHGSRYALSDGRNVNGPATFPQPTYEVRIHNGQIEVRATKASE